MEVESNCREVTTARVMERVSLIARLALVQTHIETVVQIHRYAVRALGCQRRRAVLSAKRSS